MNPSLRERISRRLEALPDDRGYQVLDYVEFLESKYAERQAPPPNVFQRFAEGVEDAMRAGRISTQAIGQTMDLLNGAMNVLSGVTAAGKSVASDLVTTATQITTNPLQRPAGTSAASPPLPPSTSSAVPGAPPNAAPPTPPGAPPGGSPKP